MLVPHEHLLREGNPHSGVGDLALCLVVGRLTASEVTAVSEAIMNTTRRTMTTMGSQSLALTSDSDTDFLSGMSWACSGYIGKYFL